MTEKTETKRVTLETIAEWRAEIENDIDSWGKDYKGMAREDLHGREIKILDALEASQTELATAREVIEESMEARRTSEAEGGALNQLNNEIDRLRAELATLRGQVGGAHPARYRLPTMNAQWQAWKAAWVVAEGYRA